jgi:hypothetical protein
MASRLGGPGQEKGFHASLHGASLPDLVQLECLARTEAVFRVTSKNEVGYLFFREGQVVHAVSGEASGQRAAVEILGWDEGTFEPCNVAWPDERTIHLSWQNLLLVAAQTQDESGRRKLVRLATSTTQPSMRMSSTPPKKPTLAGLLPGYRALVKLDADGNVLEERGAGVGYFAPAVAYAARLGHLIGDALGLERLRALECTYAASRTLVQIENSGTVVGVHAELETDVGAFRERAGL